MKILILDGDQGILEALWYALKPTGYECIACDSARVGLEVFRDGDFGVVILDSSPPDMDGAAVVHAIQEMNRETCIVVMSGRPDMTRTMREALREGDVFLEKPLDFRELMRVIAGEVARRSGRNECIPHRRIRVG